MLSSVFLINNRFCLLEKYHNKRYVSEDEGGSDDPLMFDDSTLVVALAQVRRTCVGESIKLSFGGRGRPLLLSVRQGGQEGKEANMKTKLHVGVLGKTLNCPLD